MKILIIQVGNFTLESEMDDSIIYHKFPTLLHGDQYFDEPQVINNVQTRESIESLGLDVMFYFHTHRKQFSDLVASSLRVRELTKEHQPDLTHIYWGGISGFTASLFVKGKSIVSLLGSDLFGSYNAEGNKTLQSKVQTLCSRLLPLFSTRVIVMSKRMKDYMWTLKKNKVIELPEGLSLAKFSPIDKFESRHFLNWSQDTFIVIFFYQGQGVKNFPLAEQTIHLLSEIIDNVELKIISGYKHEQLKYVYNASDCLLLTSFHEGSNNSLKEALACNTPIVSVPCGDAEERLQGVTNSYVVDYDVNELVSAIQKIHSDGGSSNGRDFIEQVSLEYCAQKVVELYKSIV